MPISNIQNIISDEFLKRPETINPSIEHTQNIDKLPVEKTSENMKSVNEIINDKLHNQEIHDAMDKMNKTIQIFNKRLKFSFHEEAQRFVVQIIDTQTDKVVREIPAKEVLNFISKLHQSLGVLIDKKR